MEKLITIINSLYEITKNKKAIWSKIDNGFIIKFEDGSYLTIHRYDKNDWEVIYSVQLYNKKGIKILFADTEDHQNMYEICRDLYDEVHNKYYEIDETLENIIINLNNAKSTIGEQNFNPFQEEEDDGLPF